jgi:hypothetical protein
VTYSRPTLIYVLSPSCQSCTQNTANINAFAQAVRSTHDVYGVTLSSAGLAEHLRLSQYPFEVLVDVSPTSVLGLKLGGTPHTIVVSEERKVVHSWLGTLAGRNAREIEDFASIRLPDAISRTSALPK